ncbi:interferon-induced 35 kDa protein [Discoglossus pictus]
MEEESFIYIEEPTMELMDEQSMRKEIERLQAQCKTFTEECSALEKDKEETETLAKKLQDRVEKMERNLQQEKEELRKNQQKAQERVKAIWDENQQLEKEAQNLQDGICQLNEKKKRLDLISGSGTERRMVFKGKVSNNIPKHGLMAKHQIQKPVYGGSALITFEQPEVADNIIRKRYHKIPMEDTCIINVKAEPVELLVLDALSVEMSISTHKVLVSNLPSSIPDEQLLDKLELFLSKSKNGGGEVECRDFLSDSRNVIITFIKEEVAPRLREKKNVEVNLDGKNYKVQVTPSLNGDLKAYEIKRSVCNRTVLITGIPDIADAETMQDLLELHFQKPSTGGGEVQVIQYIPEGKRVMATFEDDNED